MLRAGNRCDLQVLLRGRARHMQATVLQERAFGFLDAGESVLWSSVPVLQEALDAVSLLPPRAYKRCLLASSSCACMGAGLGAVL